MLCCLLSVSATKHFQGNVVVVVVVVSLPHQSPRGNIHSDHIGKVKTVGRNIVDGYAVEAISGGNNVDGYAVGSISGGNNVDCYEIEAISGGLLKKNTMTMYMPNKQRWCKIVEVDITYS